MEERMTFEQFCDRLKSDGVYIGDDWRVHGKDGKIISHKMPNGYYITRKCYSKIDYQFMEHRVIWYFINGSIPDNMQINHKDFDRANNNIENLELMTAKENINYTKNAGRAVYVDGEKTGDALFTNEEAQAIRWLYNHGWGVTKIKRFFGTKWEHTVYRVAKKKSYTKIPDEKNVLSVIRTIEKRAEKNNMPESEKESMIKGLLSFSEV